jgi:hypothetical protein
MEFFDALKQALKREPTRNEVAGDLADRLSAMEQQQRVARQSGDSDLLQAATDQIKRIKSEVRAQKFDPNDYPGLFH